MASAPGAGKIKNAGVRGYPERPFLRLWTGELGLSSLPDLHPGWPKFFQTDATRCHSPSRRPKGDVPGARYVGFIAG